MKNIFQILIITACLFSSCNNKTDKEEQDNDTTGTAGTDQPEVTVNKKACFSYQVKNDSASMQITVSDNVVSGTLDYKLFEKDKNQGKIEGKISGDTLFANYTFVSEGTQSTREVAFLKKGNDWLEGFGPVEEKQGVMSFKDRSKLRFENGLLFKAVDCD
jgi:hypothetical protein